IPVALIDAAKGAIPVVILGAWANGPAWFSVALGLAAVLGHIFSPYVGFKGGKGVATAAGMFLALAPLAVVISLPIWMAAWRLWGAARGARLSPTCWPARTPSRRSPCGRASPRWSRA